MSKPWKKKSRGSVRTQREQARRQLAALEAKMGAELVCHVEGCKGKAIGMDECLTCEKLGKSYKVLSCGPHRELGLGVVKKHALVKHPMNLLRVIGAGLKGEEI